MLALFAVLNSESHSYPTLRSLEILCASKLVGLHFKYHVSVNVRTGWIVKYIINTINFDPIPSLI